MDTTPGKHWQYNVSKKIVQLTKVVYRLHTQNIDNTQRMNEVKTQHEFAMGELEKAAEARLKDKDDDMNRKNAAFEARLRKEVKAKLKDRETAMEQLSNLMKEVSVLKQKSEQAQKSFNSATAKIQQTWKQTVSDMKEKHAAALFRSNERYEQSAQKADKRDAESRRRISELTKQNTNVKDEIDLLKKKVQDSEDQMLRLKSKNDELKKQLESMKEDVRKSENISAELKRTLEQELAGKSEGDLKRDEEIERLKAEATEREAERAKLADKLNSMMETVKELESQRDRRNSLEVSDIVEVCADDNGEATKELGDKGAEIQRLESEREKMVAKLEKMTKDMEELQLQRERELKIALQLKKLEKRHRSDIEELKARLEQRKEAGPKGDKGVQIDLEKANIASMRSSLREMEAGNERGFRRNTENEQLIGGLRSSLNDAKITISEQAEKIRELTRHTAHEPGEVEEEQRMRRMNVVVRRKEEKPERDPCMVTETILRRSRRQACNLPPLVDDAEEPLIRCSSARRKRQVAD